MSGKEIRIKRLFNRISKRMIIIPVDHGATMGPIEGIEKIENFLGKLDEKYVNGVVLCKGQLSNRKIIEECLMPKIVHLSNSSIISPDPDFKTLVGNVENAIALGADAISVHINIGNANEHNMLKDFAKVSDDCYKWGMPLLAMMYTKLKESNMEDYEKVKIVARIAQEMGADIVKVSYTGDKETFKEVVDGCSIPVIIAGGNKGDVKQILNNVYNALQVGAAGVAYGRNTFQCKDPLKMTKALSAIVHENRSVDDAMEMLRNKEYTYI